MNETAAALGLKDTRFANPSGLDDPEQYSTAYDLAVLGTYALTKPELRRIVSLRDVVIESSREPGREHGWFRPGNLNSLLATYRGAIGLKPGYTEDAGYTLVAAAERDGRTLVCVTLQSRRHFSDCTALLDFGFARATPPGRRRRRRPPRALNPSGQGALTGPQRSICRMACRAGPRRAARSPPAGPPPGCRSPGGGAAPPPPGTARGSARPLPLPPRRRPSAPGGGAGPPGGRPPGCRPGSG